MHHALQLFNIYFRSLKDEHVCVCVCFPFCFAICAFICIKYACVCVCVCYFHLRASELSPLPYHGEFQSRGRDELV